MFFRRTECCNFVHNSTPYIHPRSDSRNWPRSSECYVGYLYAREKTSRVYRHEDIDYFELLESDIAKFQNLGKVLVTGDFNGRTGTNSDFIIYDRYIDAGPDNSIQYNDIPVRFNRDRAVDAYGRRLLELCKTTSLLIANGRLGSDSETGEFTFYGEKGCSTVDYLLLSFIDFETVSYFEICDITEFSDHVGLSFGLHCKQMTCTNTPSNETTYVKKLKWDSDKVEDFKNSVSNLSDLLNSLFSSLQQNNSENNINETLNKFSDSIFACSDKHFGKSVSIENVSTPKNSNKWFDEQCRTAKTDFNRAKRIFSYDRSEQNRINFTKCRSKYNKAKRRAKYKFKITEGQKISKMAKCNPKAFWKKIKKYSSCNKVGSETLSSDDFFQHFSGVFEGDENQNDRHLNLDFVLQSNEYLNSEISQEEVTAAIRSLASNKSPGMDGLIPEIFKASADTITPFVTELFNTVFVHILNPGQKATLLQFLKKAMLMTQIITVELL